MPRLVISTVGTSLLTNQINDEDSSESNWSTRLRETANCTDKEIRDYYEDVSSIIEDEKNLKERAEDKLFSDEIEEIREASAELNGIYALYENQLAQGKGDMHWLIATDTYQGQVTAKIVRKFLEANELKADIFTPKELSTRSTETFSSGIDELLKWLDEIIPGYKEAGYKICFNLVGGFKALQGYANTIGMLYGAEIIYVFEGTYQRIIIPRLPITVDRSVIQPAQSFALMAAGAWVKLSELPDVPEALIMVVGDEASLSNWGRLTWNSCKQDILSEDLLKLPKIVYEKSFIDDYERFTGDKKERDNKEKVDWKKRVELQEKLAEVAAQLIKFNGDTSRLDKRLHYSRYENKGKGEEKGKIDHFYVNNDGWRVSCIAKNGVLQLRHYGPHDYVNDNP